MKLHRRGPLAFLLICTLALAQLQTSSNSSGQEEWGHFVVHIDVNRVQVDAVVTDAKGRPVTGLTAKDFEIFQDGMPQAINTFSYVAEGVKAALAIENSSRAKSDSAIPAPPVPLSRQQVRRQIVLMVDDLGLSPTGVACVRVALKKFVDRDMQPGDLVAIVRTGAGVGALQQFTTDRRVLYAAINQVKVHFLARASSFVPVDLSRSLEPPSIAGTTFNADRYAAADAAEKCFEDANSAIGSLAAIRYIVQGLRDLPGRKALILFSEKMQISQRPDQVDSDKECEDYRTVEAILHKVTDAAERSAVVIYTIDPHGLDPLVADASSNPFGGGPLPAGQPPIDQLNTQLKETSIADFFGKGGLLKLARETGGTFAFENDIARLIREAVSDSSSYYLLGYRPPASTFEGKNASQKFHSVAVKVKRAGLRVRSRTGFYGVPGSGGTDSSSLSKAQQFARVLMSPFTENDIHLRITSFFSEVEKPLLTTFVYIDANDLNFISAANGSQQSTINAVSATFDKDGAAVNSTQRTYTLASADTNEARDQRGAILTLQQVVTKPGPYQVRVAVRDAISGKMGSANQFIEVPNLNRGRLALSGILLKRAMPSEAGRDVAKDSNPKNIETDTTEAIRIFKPGDTIRWYYEVFNAKGGLDQRTNLKVQVRVFRDGSQIMQSPPASASFLQNPSTRYVATSGHMVLGPSFTPGDYALQVIVKDELAKKQSTAWQWIGFEVQNP